MWVLVVGLTVTACGAFDTFKDAKEAVSRGLLDPGATQFRNLEVCSEDRNVISGEFNAKNAYGAYVGFKSFYYADNAVALVEDPAFGPLVKRCYGKYAQ